MTIPSKFKIRKGKVSILGKCICVSFPYHESHLIEELDSLADQEFITRSQYLRRLIRKEKHLHENQEQQVQRFGQLIEKS